MIIIAIKIYSYTYVIIINTMKLKEKREAINLRLKGVSITAIALGLSVSKASVSNWVKDVELGSELMRKIKGRSHSRVAVESRRKSRLAREHEKRTAITTYARNQVSTINDKNLFFIGTALYWGEGSKKKRGVAEFTNSDPKMIRVMMEFFKRICNVPDSKFRGHVYLHNHLDVDGAEHYWSDVSGIPLSQFHRTSIQHNRNKVKKDTLPKGTFAIVICDTKLKLTLDGWMDGLYDKVL